MNANQAKRIVERRHPLYSANVEHWRFLDATYQGGRSWFESNVFRYHKEGDKEYTARIKRAYRFNHTREVVDIVNKHLFRTSIVRSDGAPNCLKEFWKNSTLLGVDIDGFAKIMSLRSSIEGMPWVLVDNNYSLPPNASEADRKQSKGRVFAKIIQSQDALDWRYDEDGNLDWFLYREFIRDDLDPMKSSGDMVERLKLWTKTQWISVQPKYGTDKSLVSATTKTGDHDLGAVPIVPVRNSFSHDPYYTPSLVADVAYLDRSVANYASNLDVIIQDQTFSQLAIPAQGILPGDSAHSSMVEAAHNRIFIYDGEGGAIPHFLSPDPRQAQLIIEAIRQLINEIYHSVGLAGERTKQDNAKGIDNSSGVAKQKDFERVLALLTAKAESVEYAENKIAELVCKWNGVPVPEDQKLVAYSTDFSVRDLWDEMEIALSLSLLSLPIEVLGEHKKELVRKLFPGLTPSKIKELEKIVESYEPPAAQEIAAQAGESSKAANRIVEEAKRSRDMAGQKQSKTKARETDAKD